MGEKWICSCGTECNGNFCIKCGKPKPQQEALLQQETAPQQPQTPQYQAQPQQMPRYQAQPQQDAGQQQMPRYQAQPQQDAGQQQMPRYQAQPQQGMQGQQQMPRYQAQPQQGMQGQQQMPRYQAQPQQGTGQPQMPRYQAQPQPGMVQAATEPVQKKSKKKLFMIIGIAGGAVILIAAALLLYFLVFAKNYKTNTYESGGEQLEITEGFDLFVDEVRDISFLYPKFLPTDGLDDGDYIYGETKAEMPYICINRYSGKESPESYFKSFQNENPDLNCSSINEVEVEDKTLYMVEASLPDLPGDIQQYLELYDDYYITYTAMGYEAEQPNTELYYAVQSLRPSAQAYAAPPEPDPVSYTSEMGNFSVTIPGDYTPNEQKSGIYAENDTSGLLALYVNNDSVGSIIYDKDDFAARSAQVNNYVANLLSVKEADFEDGTTETINGVDYYCYPMTLTLANDEKASGKLYIADSDSIGCYLLCYYLQDNADSDDEAAGEEFVQSMKINGSPDIDNYQVMDASGKELGKIAVKSDLVGSMGLDENMIVITNQDDSARVVMGIMDGPEVKDAAESLAASMEKKFNVKIDLKETELPDEGRYFFDGYEMDYELEGKQYVSKVIGVTDSEGNVYCMYFNVDDANCDWADEVCENIIWSWKLD